MQNESGYEISKYEKGEVSDRALAISIKKLKVAFPKRDEEFFNLLTERIIANGFSDERLSDAINKVIDSFGYKEINISDIINFDSKIKLYTYNEVCNMVHQGCDMNRDFNKKQINGKTFWIKLSDYGK